jgi:hypothetical protein
MFIYIVIILLIICLLCSQNKAITEKFSSSGNSNGSQTIIPGDQPDGLSWNFQSPKSDIQNFNERTEIRQNLNELKGNTSRLIGLNQQIPYKIYPYTYVNRRFDYILLQIANTIEKDYNNNHMLEETKNSEWSNPYPYIRHPWKLLPDNIKSMIYDVVGEINFRFNMTPPIVGFRQEPIKYYWFSQTQLIVIIRVYKKYTSCDIQYEADLLSPGINDALKNNYERELLIFFDDVIDKDRTNSSPNSNSNTNSSLNSTVASSSYHIKYLRFPGVEYNSKNPIENMRYVGEYDKLFYIAKSKDPFYRMLKNTEARDLYLEKVEDERQKLLYKCFRIGYGNLKDMARAVDQTGCELADGLWEKQCQKNTDCPYYKANKNYPNGFGGCNKSTGYCDFPLGVKPLTYRKPLDPENAQCYNCTDGILGRATIGKCCKNQSDKRVYLNLESPDYAYKDDADTRFFHRELFDAYSINWSKYV